MSQSRRSRPISTGRLVLGLAIAISGALYLRTATPQTQSPPSPVRGELVAERLCRYCHQIRPGARSDVEAQAPSFALIAATPGRDADYLRAFVNETHLVRTIGDPPVVMPTAILTPESREDVIAYILGLKR